MSLWRLLCARISVVWLLLIAATVLSWKLSHGFGLSGPRSAGSAVIVVALVKVRFVILDFMEIRGAPLAMRVTGELWVALIGALLIGLYLAAPH
jgi:hypothetical protein